MCLLHIELSLYCLNEANLLFLFHLAILFAFAKQAFKVVLTLCTLG